MRLRITFAKTGPLRYTGHLDLQKIWERTVRRAGLPLAYSRGFHPGPKIQLAAALPLGFIGRAEIVDIWLEAEAGDLDRRDSEAWKLRLPGLLQAAAPPGLEILDLAEVDARLPALQSQVSSADYVVTLLAPIDEQALSHSLSAVLEAGSLPRQRRGKLYDLRPLIESLSLTPHPSPRDIVPEGEAPPKGAGRGAGVRVFMRLAAREGATGRPEEVLDCLAIPLEDARIERTHLNFLSPAGPASVPARTKT